MSGVAGNFFLDISMENASSTKLRFPFFIQPQPFAIAGRENYVCRLSCL